MADHDKRPHLEEAVGRRTAAFVRAANEAGTVYAKTTMDRAETDVAAMIRDNNAVVIKLNTEAMRAKLQPLYADLIKEKALSKELFDAVNALSR